MSPEHEGLRPTADRVRESVFNILLHGIEGFDIEGARVIDLFAGTGALGIEALSRGAAYCLFVEEAAEARALIRTNVETFGLTGVTQDLPARCDGPRPGGQHRAVRARVSRSALRQGPRREGARFTLEMEVGSRRAR